MWQQWTRRVAALSVAGAAVVSLVACGESGTKVTTLESNLQAVKTEVSAIGGEVRTLSASTGKVAEPSTSRHYFVTLVEWKGSTTANKLAPPAVDPKTLSAGYGFKGPGVLAPEDPKKWEVATYTFSPAAMLAYQGDTVELTAFVVNGDQHTVWVQGPNGQKVVADTVMTRGGEFKLRFTASEAGTYQLRCAEHSPTMTGYVQVLPR